MKLLLTVGAQMPFDRLVCAMDGWAATHPEVRVVAQVGDSAHVASHLRASPFLAPEAFDRACDDADAIVGHAGIGTLFAAFERGKPVLVMPRRAELRETRNDHQIATAKRFGARDSVVVVWDETELAAGLETLLVRVRSGSRMREPSLRQGPLFDAIRAFVDVGTHPREEKR